MYLVRDVGNPIKMKRSPFLWSLHKNLYFLHFSVVLRDWQCFGVTCSGPCQGSSQVICLLLCHCSLSSWLIIFHRQFSGWHFDLQLPMLSYLLQIDKLFLSSFLSYASG